MEESPSPMNTTTINATAADDINATATADEEGAQQQQTASTIPAPLLE